VALLSFVHLPDVTYIRTTVELCFGIRAEKRGALAEETIYSFS